MRDHKKLKAFKLADEVALLVYRTTRTFPKEELYGLSSQMRRSAVSVLSNIVEGCACESTAGYLHSLEVAFASLRELNYQVSRSVQLGMIGKPETERWEAKINEAEKVLKAHLTTVRKGL